MKYKDLKLLIKGMLKFMELYFSFIFYKNTYVILCIPIHGNLGDQAIAYAERLLLTDTNSKAYICEIESELLTLTINQKIFSFILRGKIILLHGGGYFGSLWIKEEIIVRQVISNFKASKIIVFPQTVFFEDSEFGEKEKEISAELFSVAGNNVTICLREEYSYSLAQEIYKDNHLLLIPDIVTYLPPYNNQLARKNIVMMCLREDREKTMNEESNQYIHSILYKYFKKNEIQYLDTVVSYCIHRKNRYFELKKFFDRMAQSKVVVTDRLHGMVFAAITGTPCVVLSNCNYKIKGVYDWIKNIKYVIYVDDLNDFETALNEVQSAPVSYDNQLLRLKFEELKKLLYH